MDGMRPINCKSGRHYNRRLEYTTYGSLWACFLCGELTYIESAIMVGYHEEALRMDATRSGDQDNPPDGR